MSSSTVCEKTMIQILEEYIEISNVCPIQIIKNNPRILCKCSKCKNVPLDCDCEKNEKDNTSVESFHSCDGKNMKQLKSTKMCRIFKRCGIITKTITKSWILWCLLFIAAVAIGIVFYINKNTSDNCDRNRPSSGIEITTESDYMTSTMTTTTDHSTTSTIENTSEDHSESTTDKTSTTIQSTTDGIWNPI